MEITYEISKLDKLKRQSPLPHTKSRANYVITESWFVGDQYFLAKTIPIPIADTTTGINQSLQAIKQLSQLESFRHQ